MRSGLPVPTHAVRALYGSTAVPRLGQGTATPHNRNYVGCGMIMGYWSTSVHWHTPVGGGETEDDLDPWSYRPVGERDSPQVRALRKNGGSTPNPRSLRHRTPAEPGAAPQPGSHPCTRRRT